MRSEYWREANDLLKTEEKGNISEDIMRSSQEEVQDLTKKYIEEIDRLLLKGKGYYGGLNSRSKLLSPDFEKGFTS